MKRLFVFLWQLTQLLEVEILHLRLFAINILMAQYMPEIIKKVSARRLLNVKSIGQSKIVTACVSEYVALKSVATDVEVLSIEDLILA